jgi:hypothetical protein
MVKTPNLSDRLQQVLDAENLTVYGAAHIVAAETDEPWKTVHERISNHLKRPPKSWVAIEQTLNALGYEIRIDRIP